MTASQHRWPRRPAGARRRKPRPPVHTRNRPISPVATHDTTYKLAVEAIERAGVADGIDHRVRNPKREQAVLNAKAWLTAAMIELGATGLYDRSRVWARIIGFTAAQQTRLRLPGLRTWWVSYDACYKQALRVERALDQGWKQGGDSSEWDWFTLQMLAAARMKRDPAGGWTDPAADSASVCIDDTAFASWGHKTGPNPTAADEAAGVTSCGSDPDARNGRRTPTDSQPDEHFYGFQVIVVVSVPEVHWSGDPYQLLVRDYQPPYIINITVRPANADPGPHGYEAIVRARAVTAITEVVADMGFSMKSESFVRRLHELGIDVVMDLPPADRERVDTHMMGRPFQPVFENSGSFFHAWMPTENEVPPENLSDADLRNWHARRLIWAYTTNQHLSGGDVQLKSPFATGRLTTDEQAAKATGALHVTKPDHAPDARQAHLSLKVDKRDRHQRIPHGTWAWWLSYLRRLVVETANARLKSAAGLSNKGCKAMGIAAHTMSAVLLAAAYNLDVAQRVAEQARRDAIGHEDHTAPADHPRDSEPRSSPKSHEVTETEPAERSPPMIGG